MEELRIVSPHFFIGFTSDFFYPIMLPPHFDYDDHLVLEPMFPNFQNLQRFLPIRRTLIILNILQVNYPSWSGIHFLSINTWKTSCTWDNYWGNINLYATRPTLLSIWNDPTNLGANFIFFSNWNMLLQGDTFTKTQSPSSNSKSLFLWST